MAQRGDTYGFVECKVMFFCPYLQKEPPLFKKIVWRGREKAESKSREFVNIHYLCKEIVAEGGKGMRYSGAWRNLDVRRTYIILL